MATTTPRIPPLPAEAFSAEQAEVAKGRESLNLARVFVQHPAVYRAFIPLAEQLFLRSGLLPREREILILRALALCNEHYDLSHHLVIARDVGMSDGDIEAAQRGSAELSDFEQLLAKAAEELVLEQGIGDATWQALAQRYSVPQLMEVVFLVGIYLMMAMGTKSFGVQLEDEPGPALHSTR